MLFSKNKNYQRKSEDDNYTVDYSQEDSDSVAQWGNPNWNTAPVYADDEEHPGEALDPHFAVTLREEASIPEIEPELTPSLNSKALPTLCSDLSLSATDDIKRRFGTNIRSALGPGTVIEGTFCFDAPVCIDGTLTGEIQSSSILIVGEQAEVNARIEVGGLIILGKVVGQVNASELVEIRESGELRADIKTKRLVIEDGAVYTGHVYQTRS
jgi:cytoskeletal protein CcmA (bactofilin family)